jgi:NAD(P)-dependent dehydrogenase (short-subunit alcohol dehydrogenase family)
MRAWENWSGRLPSEKRACLIIGAGDGVGGAVARAFARDGFDVCLTRRPRHAPQLQDMAAAIRADGGAAHAFPMDARVEADMVGLVGRIEADVAPLEVAVFNIGANVRFPITETTAQVYTKVWEMAAFSGFLMGREAARVMRPRGRGTIIFTGATASLRGGAPYSAFAGAKHALRALAQSMARELGPAGIHVAHVVIDGMIDGVFARENFPDIDARLARDEILRPEEIAKNYLWLHHQHRSAWTHEMDVRPWSEAW